jgi:hypothetical protein
VVEFQDAATAACSRGKIAAAVALGRDLPRLHGVPFVVKSNIDPSASVTATERVCGDLAV